MQPWLSWVIWLQASHRLPQGRGQAAVISRLDWGSPSSKHAQVVARKFCFLRGCQTGGLSPSLAVGWRLPLASCRMGLVKGRPPGWQLTSFRCDLPLLLMYSIHQEKFASSYPPSRGKVFHRCMNTRREDPWGTFGGHLLQNLSDNNNN